MAGRVVLGLGVGLSSMAIPVYVAEASPAELRGRLVSCYNLFIVLGQAAACGASTSCAGRRLSRRPSARWRVSMGVAAAPAFLQLMGFFYLPGRRAGSRRSGDVDGAARVWSFAARARGLLRNYRAGPAAAAGDGAGGRRRLRPGPRAKCDGRRTYERRSASAWASWRCSSSRGSTRSCTTVRPF